MDRDPTGDALEDIELQLLLEGIYRVYGYDFRDYALSSLKRRVQACVRLEGLATISQLQDRVLHERACLERLLQSLSVHVTSMFRDPECYLAFRQRVVPLLRTYPFTRVWIAGCATGEEVYSMAILLQEEGLLERCRIYATDMNENVLRSAREGIFLLESMQEYTANYQRAGGTRSFSEYYTAAYDRVIFRASLRQNLVFAHHNLAMEGAFNTFHVVMCRNVMIYFNKALQERVHRLLHESLVTFGVLVLGKSESLRFTSVEARYEAIDERAKIYRKVR